MGSVWIAGSYQSDFARNYAREGLEISDMVAEAGWGHGTAGLALQPKLDRSRGEPYVFPHVRQVEGAQDLRHAEHRRRRDDP